MSGRVTLADNLEFLKSIPSESVDLVYTDPPFNTGVKQKRTKEGPSYSDSFDDFLSFLEPRIREVHRILKPSGSLYCHLDYREVHYAKVLIDQIFGRENFLNEIIWAWDYGARSKNKWSNKHNNILVHVKDSSHYYFSMEEMDRLPYKAPELCGPEKAAKGKTPTSAWDDCPDQDYWWHTIVSPMSKEKTGYPTQKPLRVISRIIRASCPPDGLVVDIFAGSGTTGAAALDTGRNFLLADSNEEAYNIMKKRFDGQDVTFEKLPHE